MSTGAPTASDIPCGGDQAAVGAAAVRDSALRLRANSEYVAIPAFALLMAALLFALFLLAIGKSPLDFVAYVWRGGFGTAFSFQNTLQRSAPLILTALAVAIPGAHRPHHDRRRGRARARRLRRGGDRRADDRLRAAGR